MKLEVKKSIEIEQGNYTGLITKIVYKTEPYDYTDVIVKIDDLDFEIVYGCPTLVTERSKLGRLMSEFTKLEVGNQVDPEEVLLLKKISFLIQKVKSKDGKEFAKIVDGTIKQLPE